jgi:hypothetical protein
MKQHKLLPTLAMSVILSCAATVSWAAETPLDTNAPKPQQTPTSEAKYSGPPIINFYLADDDTLVVKVDGLLLKNVDGFTWSGMDISEMIGQFETQGIVKKTEKDDGFQLEVKMPIQQLAGKNEFGIRYAGSNKLSATVDSEKLLAEKATTVAESKGKDDKGFGLTRIYGTGTERSGGCCYCGRCGNQYASNATLDFYAWQGYWAYIGSTVTDSYGNYDIWYQGQNEPYIHIRAEHNGKVASGTYSGPACPCTTTTIKANFSLQ